jgi:hypothetical protein
MGRVIFIVVMLAILGVSIFYLVPKFAPSEKQAIISDWVGMSVSGAILMYTLFTVRVRDKTMILPILTYAVVLAVTISGVYWWIPKYVPAATQADVIKYMFLSTSIVLMLSENIYHSFKG